MIRRRHFERILESVRAAGVGAEVDALLRPGPGGRPRRLDADVVIAAVIATIQDGRRLTFVNVHATLTTQLARSAQDALGVRWRAVPGAEPQTVTLRQVRYVFEALDRHLAHTAGSAPDLSSLERESRKDVFERLLDQIVQASLPSGVERPRDLALDTTAIEAWNKGKLRPMKEKDGNDVEDGSSDDTGDANSAAEADTDTDTDTDVSTEAATAADDDFVLRRWSADRDAAAGYRTKTYNNKSKRFFGFDAHVGVGVLPVGADPDDGPKLIHGLVLTPASSDVVDPSLEMLDRLTGKGYVINDLLADRAYSYKRSERWADELVARGAKPVFDLHPNDRGMREYEGVLIGDGGVFCPAMPRHLWVIARPTRFTAGTLRKGASLAERERHAKLTADIEEFHRLVAERQQWAFERRSGAPKTAKDQGKVRMECPAQAGKVKCANCPFSANFADDVPVVADPPMKATAPKACNQRTITIPGTVLAKLRQEHPWGSPEWTRSYSRRTHVEGIFGNLKNPSTENIDRGWCRVRGLVKTGLLLACAAAAGNIRQLRNWAKRVGYTGELLCEPDGTDHGFEELDADGSILVHGPPGQAA